MGRSLPGVILIRERRGNGLERMGGIKGRLNFNSVVWLATSDYITYFIKKNAVGIKLCLDSVRVENPPFAFHLSSLAYFILISLISHHPSLHPSIHSDEINQIKSNLNFKPELPTNPLSPQANGFLAHPLTVLHPAPHPLPSSMISCTPSTVASGPLV